MKYLIHLPLTLLMSACGGASTGINQPSLQDDAVFRGYDSGLDYVADGQVTADELGLTATDLFPASGSAEYRGAMFLGSRTPSFVLDAVVGDLALSFDLQDNTFNGNVTDFVGIDSTKREGNLLITDGSITRIEGVFDSGGAVAITANVAGPVNFGSEFIDGPSSIGVKDISGNLFGTVFGDDAQLLSGDVNVAYEIEPISVAGMTRSELGLEGYFVAEPE